MNLVYRFRFRPNDLESKIDLLDADLRAAALRRAAFVLGLAVALGVGFLLLFRYSKDQLSPLFAIIPLLIILIITVIQWERYRRKRDKFEFVRDLTRELQVDLHPHRKARLALDLRPYDHSRKLVWSGTSSISRKTKNKYRDKWLSLDVRLAEGTRVVIRREVGVKTKASSVQREKRRVFLTVQPNPSRYDLGLILSDAEQLRKRLKEAVHDMFATHPADFHVHVDPRDGGLHIKVSQTDAQIEVHEVHRLLHALIGFMAARRKKGRA